MMLTTLLLSLSLAFAQNPWDPNAPEHLEQTGKLVTVKIVPGAKETSFFFAGKKIRTLKKYDVNASMTVNGKEEKVDLIRKNGHYVTSTPLQGEELHLKFIGEEPKGNEEFNIPLKKH